MGGSFGIFAYFIVCTFFTLGTTQDPSYPSFTKTFATRVEATFIINDGTYRTNTIIVDEYHDLTEKRGVLLIDSNPFYYFYKMNQAIIVDDKKKCSVSKIDESDLFKGDTYFGWFNKEKAIVGPSAFLMSYNPTYEKTEEIRGITCNKFVVKHQTDNVDISFYIADKTWVTANKLNATVPVRVAYKGTRKINGRDIPVEAQMDFVVFTEGVTSESILKIPYGLGCKGLNIHPDKTFPKINDQMSFTMEVFDVKSKRADFYVSLIRLWFDHVNQYVRIDGYDSDFAFYSEVQDFNTGVSYRMFKNDSCFLNPIQSPFTEGNQKGFMGNMKSAKEFLYFDGDYYFLGMEFYRSIYSEVWETVRSNVPLGDVVYQKAVFTYYIMAPKLEEVSGGDASVRVPVAMTITAFFNETQKDADVVALYNIFDFDEMEGRLFLSELNLEKCFEEESQKNYFAIHFPVNNTELSQGILQKEMFRDVALLQLSEAASASLIRFPFVQIYGTGNEIVLLALMLNRPPSLAGFAVYNNSSFVPTTDMDQAPNVNNPEECADLCLSKDATTPCREFALCPASLNCAPPNSCKSQCFLGQSDVTKNSDKPVRPGNFSCIRYARAVAEEVINEVGLTESLQQLNASINSGKFKVTFDSLKPDTIPTYNFIAKRLETGLKPFNDFNHDILYETVYSDFQIKDASETFLSFDIDEPLATVETCYQRCRSDPRLPCASFSYCPTSGKCRLSPLYLSVDIPSSSENVESSTSCKVYRKRDSDFFEETPGKIPKVRGSKQLENVPTRDACAVWCKSEKSINCKGYEFCSETKSCVLHESHNVEESKLGPNENSFCTHYYLKYSSEFVRAPGIEIIEDKKAQTIFKLSFEECAKACRESVTNCRSINFCPVNAEEDSICSLNTVALSDSDVKRIPSGICQHYSLLQSLQEQSFPFQKINDLVKNGGYQTKVEVTRIYDDIDNTPSWTYVVDEFHDWHRKRGRIEKYEGGIQDSLYYFSDSQQTISVGSKSCQVASFQNITFINMTVLFEWLEPKNLIAGPSSVLWREMASSPTQISETTVRGIPCIKYTAVDKTYSNVTLNFYQSKPNWKGPGSSNNQIPIRVDVLGDYVLTGTTGPKIKLNIVIDFISFIPEIPKFSTFQVPSGVGCEGLKSNGAMIMPMVEDQFSYTTEVYNIFKSEQQIKNHVLLYKFWFDAINQVMSVHGVDRKFKPFTLVADFSTGVQYLTRDNGICTLGGINDPLVRSDPAGIVRTMQDGNKFLGLDETYYYLGRGLTRNVYCDIWESVKNEQYFVGKHYKRIVQTVYFMAPEFRSVTSNDENAQVPVKIELRLQVNATSPVELMESNTFDFDDAEKGLFDIYNNIDVERCFTPETQKEYFMVHFPIPIKIQKQNKFNRASLAQKARVLIANEAKVSLLRISSIRLFTDTVIGESDISILGVMLDKAPPLAGFYLYMNSEGPFTSEDQLIKGKSVTDDCAAECVSNDKCKGFTFCKGAIPTCYLTNKDVGDGEWIPQSETKLSLCQLYFRSDLNSKANEPNITQALQNIQDSITVGKLILELSANEPLIASRIDKKLTPFNWQDKDLYETAFTQRKLDKGVETVKEVLSTSSASECYQMCQDETGIFCSSFSFCRADGNCRLSSVFVDENRESSLEEMEKVPATSCNVYRKAAVNFFEKYPGMTTQREGQKHQSTLASANECALACREEKSFSCKGFEFCDTTRVCVMHDTHSLDLDVENKLKPGAPVCSHYSLKYSTEFADMGQFELTGPTSRIENALTFEECAKACSVSSNSVCQSINYCEGSMISASRCQLFSVTSDDPGYELQNSKNCSHYIRRSQSSPRPSIGSVADGSDRVSGGRFASTIIGVIIFGIVLGAGAFLAYSMYRSRHQNADGTAVRYVKNP